MERAKSDEYPAHFAPSGWAMSLKSYELAVHAQFADTVAPNYLTEVSWVRDYLNHGSPAGTPILLALAENWEGPAPDLCASLQTTPPWLDGYQFSMWGESTFRRSVGDWLRADQGLNESWDAGESLAQASTWSGTRSAMFDFARLLRRKRTGQVAYASPSYDYGRVFGAAGFQDGGIALDPTRLFAPDPEKLVEKICRPEVAVLVLNTQHNPLAYQWSSSSITRVLEVSLERDIAIVFDDAHFGIVAPGVERVSALKLWLQLLASQKVTRDWAAIRSLGKQLNCNGWGVGMITAPRRVLEPLIFDIRPEHEYNINARTQYAIARYLKSPQFTLNDDIFNARIECNRVALFEMLRRLGLEPANARSQVCTPFSWFELPQRSRDSSTQFDRRRLLLAKSGVLAGNLSPSAITSDDIFDNCLKIYLGVHPEIFAEATSRMGYALSQMM
jgi:aspartate/methionine/tyrosine aminotransferase